MVYSVHRNFPLTKNGIGHSPDHIPLCGKNGLGTRVVTRMLHHFQSLQIHSPVAPVHSSSDEHLNNAAKMAGSVWSNYFAVTSEQKCTV